MELKDLGLQSINIDLQNDDYNSFYAKEKDKGSRGLLVKILKNGLEIDTTGIVLKMYAKPKDNEIYVIESTIIDITKGVYEIIYPAQILQSGVLQFELILFENDNILSTKKFEMDVESGLASESALIADDYIPLFDQVAQAIAKAEQATINTNIAINGANTATTNANLKIIDVEARFNALTTEQQAESEVIDARQGKASLTENIQGIKTEFTAHKEEITTLRQQDNLKVATVEKELNDYKGTIANVNVNQEAKQKVNGYGIVSLPKNSANGQVGVSLKGNTVTNETGTKSTISASRLKSVGKNLNPFSLEQKASTGIQNATYVSVLGYIKVQPNTSYKAIYKFAPAEFKILWYDSNKNFISEKSAYSNTTNIATSPSNACFARVQMFTSGGLQLSQEFIFGLSSTFTQYEPYTESTQYLPNVGELRSLPNGVSDEIKVSGGKAELVKRVSDTMEELAEPIITPIEVSGILLSNPSGTVYVENVVADAGNYTTKFDIKELQLPIKSIDKLIKYNFETGVQTVLDTSLAVINEDKLSFTHPNLTDKDMVFIDYYYDVEGTLGETTIEYLDSRHTIKDTTNDKFYSWDIKSTNGVPTVELTEVL